MTVVPATQVAEVTGIIAEAHEFKTSLGNAARPHLKNKTNKTQNKANQTKNIYLEPTTS